MPRGTHVKAIDVPIFHAHVVLYTRRKAFAKHRLLCTDKPFDVESCDGASSDFDPVYLVGVFDGKLATLVHELAHTTFKILRHCGIRADADAQEAFCYLQEWLFEQLRDTVQA